MEIKDYLIIYGMSVERGYPCYKETEIECDELVKYMPIISAINKNIGNTTNWSNGITIERISDGVYVEHNHLYEMYPEFSKELLNGLSKYFPDGITHIESIKIFSGQKIKII